MKENCLALMIGNSRLHWAWFVEANLQDAWNTDYLPAATIEQLAQHRAAQEILPPLLSQHLEATSQLPLYLASVVPEQTKLWQTYPESKVITLEQVPLLGLYSTLGIDRALAVLGAGERYGYPVLVIDAGTALTFTGADAQKRLIGGAILSGLGLQLKSLTQNTATLPAVQLPPQLPPRWARQTAAAIQSGVVYTVLAGIQDFITDWQQQFPDSQIVLTGGDSRLLQSYLQAQFPQSTSLLIADSHLIFWGMRSAIG